MSLDADTIVDRRRLRRKLIVLAHFRGLLLIVAAVGGAAVLFADRGAGCVAVRQLHRAHQDPGLIRGDTERVEALERLGKSNRRAPSCVHVDSPGGTTAGSEQLHDALRKLRRAEADWWW